MTEIIDVKSIAQRVREDLKARVVSLRDSGKGIPTLATILVGNDPGSEYYMASQKKACDSIGAEMLKMVLPEDTAEDELLRTIRDLNDDGSVHGIMVLFPLPKGISEGKVAMAIDPSKDVDGVNPVNIGLVASTSGGVAPCTPESVLEILKASLRELKGMHAVIIGRSNIVGKPLIQLLLREHMTVTVCHSRTKDLREVAKSGDVVVAAVGKPLMIDDSYIREGAVVIDVGTSEFEGRITGDVDLAKVTGKASKATKVPGGVGMLTTVLLMRNLVDCAEKVI
ncbi:bifunctional 5,10-methylenetetrahydrofolate dehydrogenase/5,10-methenyltetrahydrofolate cyclohydrolase [Youngiibacter multivorans]|uniref:Bifunctional protein FolD n=1 Tax=Youngiibacter multivorans TaxID=937251 RepID=A0ABS4G889_9CLOT|nr:methylenetetrahydrofolate dehydrogenase (NADP+)/methenyltetrahydrofolate cyclohydrolase [Youngiibacter multivorans]